MRRVTRKTIVGSPAPFHFAPTDNFRLGLTLVWMRLQLGEIPVAEDVPGYRLRSWTGVVPDELADSLAAAKQAIADMPLGSLDFGTFDWDAPAVRAAAEEVLRGGDQLLTVAAVSEADGGIAAFGPMVSISIRETSRTTSPYVSKSRPIGAPERWTFEFFAEWQLVQCCSKNPSPKLSQSSGGCRSQSTVSGASPPESSHPGATASTAPAIAHAHQAQPVRISPPTEG